MAQTTLTDAGIKRLPVKRSKYRVRDGLKDPSLRGFGVVVHTSGTRSFFLSYTSPETGQRTEGALGIHPALSLKTARELARRWRQQIREGVDPKREAERQREAQQAEHAEREAAAQRQQQLGTVEKLFDLYIGDLELDGKRSANYVRAVYERDIAPAIGSLKAHDITEDHCADIIAAVADRGALVLANRVRGYLVSAFNFGMEAKRIPRWRARAPEFEIIANPAAQTRKALDESSIVGERALSAEELRRVWLALDEAFEVVGGNGASRLVRVDIYTATALRLLFATGQRVEEVLHATWDEFDTKAMLWSIPASRRKNRAKNKSKEPHVVPLEPLHLRLLDAVRPHSGGGRYLFPVRVREGQLPKPRDHRSLSQAVGRLCARLDMEPWSPRDIRRTWKTLAGAQRIDLELRNRIQGHAFSDVGSRHYDRFDYLDAKREAMRTWCAFLERLLAPTVVVPFERSA